MHTGDARTGLPFFFNRVPTTKFTRVFLPVQGGEVLALDIAFPASGHDPTKPMYMVLHGINGGSKEDYTKDLVWRRTKANSTVVVMISRGLMDTPLRGFNIFHGARWSDAHETAQALRTAMDPGQILAGVGYSMVSSRCLYHPGCLSFNKPDSLNDVWCVSFAGRDRLE